MTGERRSASAKSSSPLAALRRRRQPLQRPTESIEQIVDFSRGDDQRRAEGDDVADRADDQAFLVTEFGDLGPERAGRVERSLGSLVRHKLQRADQTDAARLADEGMVSESPDARLELRRQSRGGADQVALLDNVEIFQRDRRSDGMA